MSLNTEFDESTSSGPPAVSVGITLYNYGHYIGECLDSLCAQDLADFDVIVVDDCSTDDSVERAVGWMKSHHRRFRRARVLRHLKNLGLAHARNALFEAADAPNVFVLDADNKLLPGCLREHLETLERTRADFAFGIIATFGETHNLVSAIEWAPAKLRLGNFYDAMSLIPVATWKTCGGYATDMPAMGWEDFDFWIRCCKRGLKGVSIPKILSLYRTHKKSMINVETNPREVLLRKYLSDRHPGFLIQPHHALSIHRALGWLAGTLRASVRARINS